jgi:ABC-2 type transport system ATP-binding protein
MTASLPLPDDSPPDVDGGDDSEAAREAAPASSRAPVRTAAALAAADSGSAVREPATPRTTPRKPATPRTAAAKKPAASPKAAAKKPAPRRPAAKKSPPPAPPVPAVDAPVTAATADPIIPGPPPPLPADIVIPPRPPLPPVPPVPAEIAAQAGAREAEPVEPGEATSVAEPPTDDAARAAAGSESPPLQEPEAPALQEPEAPALREPEQALRDDVIAAQPEVLPAPEAVSAPARDALPEAAPEAQPEPELALQAVLEVEHEQQGVPEREEGPAAVTVAPAPDADAEAAVPALTLRGVTKTFGGTVAVDSVDLTVPAGSFYGIVGPNGAGKTTTLSMIAGLLRPDGGSITVNGVDARRSPAQAKRAMGVLPDRLRTFDRLTGRQLLYYYGVLRGLSSAVVESRIGDLARAFDLVDALGRSVSDYSAGMTKKVMLAGALIHSPRLLVLDEPFESVDPVSSAVILDILTAYVEHGGTVILSSHGMEFVERVCSRVAVLVAGQVLAEGTVDEVRGPGTLQERFLELAGGAGDVEGLEWLHSFSD